MQRAPSTEDGRTAGKPAGTERVDEPFVSVIIPLLDDVPMLQGQLAAIEAQRASAEPGPSCEILVVDGGTADQDGMRRARGRFDGVTWLASPPGRGRQMNEGARRARGRWLIFLHADTRLAVGWMNELCRVDADAGIVGGSFRFRLDSNAWWARWMERAVAMRVRLFGLAYGDQALFVRRAVFEAMHGYREIPLMEDVELVRRLARKGRLMQSPLDAVTSARRFERDGWLRRSSLNLVLVLLFLAGASPAWLAGIYERTPTRPARVPPDAQE